MKILLKDTLIKVLFKNEFLEIGIDEPISLLVLRWKRQITSEERVAGYERAFAYLKSYAIRNMLVDNEAIFLFSQHDKAWLAETFNQWISEARIKRFALVTSDLYKNLTDLGDFIASIKKTYPLLGNVEHEFFIDYKTARQWIQEGSGPLLN